MIQSELEMEKQLVEQLIGAGYEPLEVSNESHIAANFRQQLGYHNRALLGETPLSHDEFEQVLSRLRKGTLFDKSKRLREHVMITRSDGSSINLQLFNAQQWCQNHFQVVRQITNRCDRSHSRYDVTILINGLPLVQIELKARGMDLKSAFDQIVRYQKTSYTENSGLFDYIQIFVISNGVNTRYFSTNTKLNYQFTFPWADKDNNPINQLNQFADIFLERCHIAKMIARYIVHHETRKTVLVMRPYQFYAVESILERVGIGRGDGFIWHTTGSGKTLTSFKASKLISGMSTVSKVVFVVDRRDLDYQTAEEFNAFSKGSVDSTDNTRVLVDQLSDPGTKLIVTTIQKLNTAISHRRYQDVMKQLREQRVVFIFDECHRSQFGDTHRRICDFFQQKQMFGFTGTPIFKDNAVKTKYGIKTTKDLFGDCLHTYIITDAIKDGNVLRFSVEYRDTKATYNDSELHVKDTEVIQDKHYLSSEKRIQKVVDDILSIHAAKTHQREYTAMMCVSSVSDLMVYYRLLKTAQQGAENPLRLATIFSCNGGDTKEFDGVSDTDSMDAAKDDTDPRVQFLKSCVADYNADHKTSYDVSDSEGFYRYYQDISKRVRSKDVDILLVVNMFLTGFDSPTLNTLYVDKQLRFQGLIQAFSRTNRVFDVRKSHGNIVCYRPLKPDTDEALAIFANRYAKSSIGEVIGTVIMKPYEDLKATFNEQVSTLKAQVPTPADVDNIVKESDQIAFIEIFRDVIRIQNTLKTFSNYSDELAAGALAINEQELRDFESKYRDKVDTLLAAEKAERQRKADERLAEIERLRKEGKMSEAEKKEEEHRLKMQAVLGSMQFDIELIERNEINVEYILKLIEKLDGESDDDKFDDIRTFILDTLSRNQTLRHKSELFASFIDEEIKPNAKLFSKDELGDISTRFEVFAEKHRVAKNSRIAGEFSITPEELEPIVADYLYSGRLPSMGDALKLLKDKFPFTERSSACKRFIEAIEELGK